MSILVLTTGGTIGAMAYPNPERCPDFVPMPKNGEDFVRDALKKNFSHFPVRCISLEPRDSKDIDDKYRQYVSGIIEKAPESKILITIGTDRILQAGEHFYHQLAVDKALHGHVIILVGSMIPVANGPESDGYQNVEFALQQLQRADMKSGVFIVLSDYEHPETESGAWKPCLYPFEPWIYEKVYATDSRFNRIKKIK